MKSPKSARSPKSSSDTNTLIVCVLVIVLIVIGLYYVIVKNNKSVEGFESSSMELNNLTEKPNPRGNEVVLVLFYVDWCPHCVSTKPEWQKLVSKMNNQKVNGANVKVHACNAEGSAVEKEFSLENNVQGYPTVKLLKENEVVEYNGARNADALEDFVKNNAN
jgi:thiol-disulfide isomerase/thioredoxin